MCVTCRPRASSRAPTEALARPLPIEETPPPVTNTYFVGLRLKALPPSVDRWRIAYPRRARESCGHARSRSVTLGHACAPPRRIKGLPRARAIALRRSERTFAHARRSPRLGLRTRAGQGAFVTAAAPPAAN